MGNDAQLRKLQEIELSILKSFKEICNKYNLTYYLSGGTLLGAVRHKGFIPWDDDVDVSMPYSDYVRFLEIGQQELGEEYFLQTTETDRFFDAPFAKIRLNNSTFLDSKFAKRHINHGIWIDIFPMIYASKSQIPKIMRQLKICKAIQMDDLIRSNSLELKNEYGRKTIFCLNVIHRIIPFSLRKKGAIKLLKSICSSKPNDYFVEVAGGVSWFFPVNVFEKTIDLEFEDELFCAPEKYKVYLEIGYNNYMMFPPEEERVGIHADIIDFEHSWKELKKKRND